MPVVHFLNVLEGDCNIIQHDSGRVTVIDVSNADNKVDTKAERAKKESKKREEMRTRTHVPSDKTNYYQKLDPDNPIEYLRDKLGVESVFRFIITHPDMDHLDGVMDFLDEFKPVNVWDTENKKKLNFSEDKYGGYNSEDWDAYLKIRDDKPDNRKVFYAGDENLYYTSDNLKILCPTRKIVDEVSISEDYNDLSYVLLFTPPQEGGGSWKILFAGDSGDLSWEYIVEKFGDDVKDVDVLLAPHHGRDSGRDYTFLDSLNPRVTLFGNASSEHLAYNSYPKIRITNNQAGYVVIDATKSQLDIYVKHFDFARDFRNHKGWGPPTKNTTYDAYFLFGIEPRKPIG